MERLRDSFKPIVNHPPPLEPEQAARRRGYWRRAGPLIAVALVLGLLGGLLGWPEGVAIAVALIGAAVFAWALGVGTDWRAEGVHRDPDRFDALAFSLAAVLFGASLLLDREPLVAAGASVGVGVCVAAWLRERRSRRARRA